MKNSCRKEHFFSKNRGWFLEYGGHLLLFFSVLFYVLFSDVRPAQNEKILANKYLTVSSDSLSKNDKKTTVESIKSRHMVTNKDSLLFTLGTCEVFSQTYYRPYEIWGKRAYHQKDEKILAQFICQAKE